MMKLEYGAKLVVNMYVKSRRPMPRSGMYMLIIKTIPVGTEFFLVDAI